MYPWLATSGVLVVTGLAFQLTSTGFGMSLQGLVPKASNFSFLSKLKSAPQKGFASAIQAVALLRRGRIHAVLGDGQRTHPAIAGPAQHVGGGHRCRCARCA